MPYLYLTVVNHDVFVWLQKTNMTKSDAPLAAIIAKMGILQSKLFTVELGDIAHAWHSFPSTLEE